MLPHTSFFRHKLLHTMGNNSSLPQVDAFSQEEVSRLEKRFHKLDLDRSGSISIGEFVSVPELKDNPLVKRVVDIFDSDLNGEVDFKGKCSVLFKILFSFSALTFSMHTSTFITVIMAKYLNFAKTTIFFND